MSSSRPILPPIDSPPPLDIPVLAPDSGRDTIRPARPAHANVLARLQALFPSSPHTQHSPSAQTPDTTPVPPPLPPKPIPKFIKVRILTWNMYDSLPKGDVEELLGSVPTSNPSLSNPPDAPHSLPVFPASPDHPYHIVIVAGQECPSASGIPMALGAGFKLNNKDNSRSRHSLLPLDADESIHRKSAEAEILSPTIEKTHEHHHPPSSWSSILENWYCHPPAAAGPLTATASDPNLKTQHERQRTGPYELLIKERMMGLYLAVFIHRDARPFVQGTSKSAVTAGLIGGRVGNKGGVGVSVNLDGTTLLFINAHLAAHEGKLHHRLADLAKIKAELSVDDYLSPDDPRFMAEDITDRFDTSFIFGDLNFRLDITRLHADWLITRKEYEQAFEFDQLRKIMASDDFFAGFHEAQICFPPTFKYDVLRTIKRTRTKSLKRIPVTPTIVTTHEKLLSEVAEHEQEHMAEDDRASEHDEDDPEPDGASIASSAWTSVRSRRTVDPEPDQDDERDADEATSSRFFLQSPPANASTSKLMHKMWSAAAAHKAKEKWISVFNTNSPKSPSYKEHGKPNGNTKSKRQSWRSSKSAKPPEPARRASQPSSDYSPQTPIDPGDPRQTRSGRAKELQAALLDAVNAHPHKHLALSVNNVDLEEEHKGVYDSSHKQRVPSWCDRILWKSTMVPEHDSDTEDAESQHFVPLRAKMGQFFSALRPSSLRSRRDSTWSMNHPDLSQTPIPGEPTPHPHFHLQADRRHPPASRVHSPTRKAHPLRRISQTRSVDSFQRSSSDERSLARIHSHELSGPSLAPSSGNVSGSGRGVPLRHANTISPVMPVAGGDTSAATSATLVSPPLSPALESPLDMVSPATTSPSPSAPMFRWLLPFFYKDGPHQQQAVQPEPQGAATPRPEPPPPRRGDVVCLKYDTLDDRGMRRLEGRSDHRPVIGSYAVYV
ncbi:hypothetical protein C8Q80DRAFT_1164548 [Daedaleopsis nitida]|nr:hypothetical protein C8Q80DRAFT_1164548 [Daedaleopsis nitida]